MLYSKNGTTLLINYILIKKWDLNTQLYHIRVFPITLLTQHKKKKKRLAVCQNIVHHRAKTTYVSGMREGLKARKEGNEAETRQGAC